MDENNWEPDYTDFDEGPVCLRECEPLAVMRTNNEILALFQNAGDETYRGNGAVFWIDVGHIYLRFDWGLWIPLSNDSPEICREITRRRAMTLNVYTGTDCKSYPLRIYQIDKLPEKLFGISGESSQTSDKSGREKAPEPPVGQSTSPFTRRTGVLPEVKLAHQTCDAILAADGAVIESHLKDEPRYDFAFVNGRHYVISYFASNDLWATDDEYDTDDWPLWYSSTGVRRSPLAIARALDAHFKKELPKGTPFATLMMLSADTALFEEDEFIATAQACGIIPVRLCASPYSNIKSLQVVLHEENLRAGQHCNEQISYAHVIRAFKLFDPEKTPPSLPPKQ